MAIPEQTVGIEERLPDAWESFMCYVRILTSTEGTVSLAALIALLYIHTSGVV